MLAMRVPITHMQHMCTTHLQHLAKSGIIIVLKRQPVTSGVSNTDTNLSHGGIVEKRRGQRGFIDAAHRQT